MIHATIGKYSIFLFNDENYIACFEKSDNMKIKYYADLKEFQIDNDKATIWVAKYEINF